METQTPAPSPVSPAWKPAALLAVLSLGLWSWTGGLWDLWGADEGRYVQVAHELLGRPNWLLLTLLGEPYDQKPPLPFWIYAAMLKLNGGEISTWLVRLPPVLFAIGTVFLTWLIGRHRLGERAGLMAALVLMTTAQFAIDAPSVELNVMLTGWVTLGLWAWLTRPDAASLSLPRAVVLTVAMIGAFFTKGPPGLMVLLAAPLVEAGQRRSWKLLVGVLPSLGVTLGLAALWLVAQAKNAGTEFVGTQAEEQTVGRVFGTDHAEPFYWYFPQLFVGIMPLWSVALVAALALFWRRRRETELSPAIPILGWALVPFLIFMIASGKRQSYLLPILPATALLVGWFFDKLASERPRLPRIGACLVAACGVGALAFAAIAVVCVAQPDAFAAKGFDLAPWQAVPLVLMACGFVAAGAAVVRAGRATTAVFGGLVAIVYFMLLMDLSIVRPAVNIHNSTRAFALEMDPYVAQTRERLLAGVGKAGRAHYHVYGHYHVIELHRDNGVLKFPAKHPELIVARESDLDEVGDDLAGAGYLAIHHSTASDDAMVLFALPEMRERLPKELLSQ